MLSLCWRGVDQCRDCVAIVLYNTTLFYPALAAPFFLPHTVPNSSRILVSVLFCSFFLLSILLYTLSYPTLPSLTCPFSYFHVRSFPSPLTQVLLSQLAALPLQQQSVLKRLLESSIPDIDAQVAAAGRSDWNRYTHRTALYSTLLYYTVYCIVQYCAVLCCAILYNAIQTHWATLYYSVLDCLINLSQ